MGGSGGGGGGEADWPDNHKDIMWQLMSGFSHNAGSRPDWQTGPGTGPAADWIPNIMEDIHYAHSDIGGNPWTGVNAWNPNEEFNALRKEMIEVKANIWTNFDQFFTDNRRSMAIILDRYTFDVQANAFKSTRESEYNETISQMNGAFLDIRGVQTSNYSQFLALQHAKIIDEPLRKFEADLELKYKDLEASGLLELNRQRIMAASDYAQKRMDEVRMRIMAKQDETQIDQKYELSEATWDLELYQHAANLLAGLMGGVQPARSNDENNSILGAFGNAGTAGLMASAAGLGPLGIAGAAALGGIASLG